MQIEIAKIHPASDPIRKSWDEDKLNELAQSIAEQGLIVPIKVRPHPELEKWICSKHGYWTLAAESDFDSQELGECLFCGELQDKFWGEHEHAWFEYEEGEIEPAFPFEVVYGHRRLEALRRNGATEIECLIEGLDNTNALVQALVENVQREDMTLLDRAETFRRIKETTGWSGAEMARRLTIDRAYLVNTMALLDDPKEIRDIVDSISVGATTAVPANILHDTRTLDSKTRMDVIEKVRDEGLNERQGIRLIQSIRAAPSEQAKKMLLEHEYSHVIHDPEHIKARAARHGAHDPFYQNDSGKTEQKVWDSTPEVKMVIDGITEAAKAWTTLIAEIRKMVQVGKLAPEGKSFTASKLRTLAQTLNRFADELESE